MLFMCLNLNVFSCQRGLVKKIPGRNFHFRSLLVAGEHGRAGAVLVGEAGGLCILVN